jgi:hypothetical protein
MSICAEAGADRLACAPRLPGYGVRVLSPNKEQAGMSETIAQVRNLLETRLRELEREARQLAESLKALGGGRPQRAQRKGKKPKAARRARKRRAPRGQRRKQFLSAVKEAPGATASEVAKQIGVSPSQAAGVARQLVKSGEIRKAGKGYAPIADGDSR